MYRKRRGGKKESRRNWKKVCGAGKVIKVMQPEESKNKRKKSSSTKRIAIKARVEDADGY